MFVTCDKIFYQFYVAFLIYNKDLISKHMFIKKKVTAVVKIIIIKMYIIIDQRAKVNCIQLVLVILLNS